MSFSQPLQIMIASSSRVDGDHARCTAGLLAMHLEHGGQERVNVRARERGSVEPGELELNVGEVQNSSIPSPVATDNIGPAAISRNGPSHAQRVDVHVLDERTELMLEMGDCSSCCGYTQPAIADSAQNLGGPEDELTGAHPSAPAVGSAAAPARSAARTTEPRFALTNVITRSCLLP